MRNFEHAISSLAILEFFCLDSEDGEELRKWNADEDKKQLEIQKDELFEEEKSTHNSTNHRNSASRSQYSIEENTTASVHTGCSSMDLFPEDNEPIYNSTLNLELQDTCHYDQTNTIPSGQGDPFQGDTNENNRSNVNTGFTKLFRGIQDSPHTSDDEDKSNVNDKV